jgi:branched-chain amino acid transport system ATP-binding protein
VLLQVKEIMAFYEDSCVLQGVSMEIAEGELVALLGRNGVGKSTTLKSIMGIVPPRSGSVLFKDEEMRGRAPYYVARKGIGYVPEERRIFPGLTVRENLIMGMKTGKRGKSSREWTIDRVYTEFPQLASRDGVPGGNLSGGEQQMLTLMRSLMGDPELILIDEPSEGLSPIMAGVIFDIITKVHGEGMSIILVDRNLAYACTRAERVYLMSKGRIGYAGNGKEVLEDKKIQAEFLAV